ncbi:BRO family protein [uncultured Clostridium sp.]|uniref:BRO family protein n=1 Tax=uncultured Clostridium sp. TaxID=59620 RepID=UPI0026077656|nr:BRO family protein [uncultured Clostridium sp.]
MNDILRNNFKGKNISVFLWRDKICFLPFEVASALDYADEAKSIQDCIKKEDFEEGEEFFILKGEELKVFKGKVGENNFIKLKRVSKLIIFTEIGVYGFLQYSQKKLAIAFKKWIRSEVLPSIREKGYYKSENYKNVNEIYQLEKKLDDKFSLIEVKDDNKEISNLEKIKVVNETFKLIKEIRNNKNNDELEILESLYNSVGLDFKIKLKEEIFLDVFQIAVELGIYTDKGEVNTEAIIEILKRIKVISKEKKIIHIEYHGKSESIIKYSRTVIDKIIEWIVENDKPILLENEKEEIFIVYE